MKNVENLFLAGNTSIINFMNSKNLLINKQIIHCSIAIGNPFNCTKDLSWFLNSNKNKQIIDRDKLFCTDINYAGRPVLTVMQFKLVVKV